MSKRPPKNYVNNPRFLEELVRYQTKLKEAKETGTKLPRIPEYIGECVLLIATRLATKPQFNMYSWKDEMVSDGIEACFKYAVNAFNPQKSSNPFAYFTQTIYNSYINRIKIEKMEQFKKLKVLETYCMGNDELSSMFYNNDITQTYIEKMTPVSKKKPSIQKPTLLSGLELFTEEFDTAT